MMEKEKKSEPIKDVLLTVKKNITYLGAENTENRQEIIEESLKKLDDIINFFNGIKKLFLILFISVITLFILLGVSLFYNNKAKNINSEIDDLKTDSIANQILEVKKIMKADSSFTTTYNYQTRNNKIVSYNQLVKENDSLKKSILFLDSKIISLKDKKENAEQKIGMAKKYYDINFIEYKKNNKSYIKIESKKIDSALILLNMYRDKLKYNKATDSWSVE